MLADEYNQRIANRSVPRQRLQTKQRSLDTFDDVSACIQETATTSLQRIFSSGTFDEANTFLNPRATHRQETEVKFKLVSRVENNPKHKPTRKKKKKGAWSSPHLERHRERLRREKAGKQNSRNHSGFSASMPRVDSRTRLQLDFMSPPEEEVLLITSPAPVLTAAASRRHSMTARARVREHEEREEREERKQREQRSEAARRATVSQEIAALFNDTHRPTRRPARDLRRPFTAEDPRRAVPTLTGRRVTRLEHRPVSQRQPRYALASDHPGHRSMPEFV